MDPDSLQPPYDESHALAVKGHFDASYYLAVNADVRERRLDPLAHFLTIGWREGRNPSHGFNVAYYRRANPDVAAVGLNPLVHYAWCGAREGRLPRRPLDALRTELERVRAPRITAKDWAAGADQGLPLDRLTLARWLASAIVTRPALVISVSHDDYDLNLGGVQNVIREERSCFERMNVAFLHLSPAAPLPMLAEPKRAEDFYFSLRLGASRLGIANAKDLIACLTELQSDERASSLVVHHFMGHAPEVLLELANVATDPTIIWTHDYFTLCPNYSLLRNHVRFCGAPPVAAAACGVCAYGTDRVEHLPRMRAFFEAVRPVVLAPSDAALDLWLRKGNLPHRGAHVQSLARLMLAPESLKSASAKPMRPLRIAHLGMRTPHKGWAVFEELALRFAGDPRYAFYQLGMPHGAGLPECIRNVHVQVSREMPNAMIEAVAEYSIDVVVSWSLWPETFCFAVYEALAGGAFVLARQSAGNVADAIKRNAPEQGHVLENEAQLFELFAEAHLENMLGTANRRYGVLIAESGSAAWLRRASRKPDEPVPESKTRSVAPANV